jgi:hypothetical protein
MAMREQDKHMSEKPTDVDPIDSMLAEWHQSLQCTDAQSEEMLNRVMTRMESTQQVMPLQPMASVGRTWFRILGMAASVLLVLGASLPWLLRLNPNPSRQPNTGSLEQVAFSVQDIDRNQRLACEMSRLFEQPILIRQRNTAIDFDVDPFNADAEAIRAGAPRVMLRWKLQRSQKAEPWQTIATEDVIGGPEHQLLVPLNEARSMRYWSHLLSDNTLWVEWHMQSTTAEADQTLQSIPTSSADDAAQDSELRLLPNEPQIAWEITMEHQKLRLWLVFELLKPCEVGTVL